MTSFEVQAYSFDQTLLAKLSSGDERLTNWPVVYTLTSNDEVYVGETLSALKRMRQHLANEDKRHLRAMRVVLHDEFNKSAALDLESFLIRMLDGDDRYRIINRNQGTFDSDYFERERYTRDFHEVFERLREAHVFERTLPEIKNSDLFKYSPFKTLVPEQALAVEDILDSLRLSLTGELAAEVPIVVEGGPGTGKTVVAMYLLKLLRDLATVTDLELAEDIDRDTRFGEFFTPAMRELLEDRRIGIVIPQQSLRKTIARILRKTPHLSEAMVLDPFAVGKSSERYSILIVDEAHRLNQRANQPSASQNKQFAEINVKLFGEDDPSYSQLDWIVAQSDHQVLLLDPDQSVRPADLPRSEVEQLVTESHDSDRYHHLHSQMRLKASDDYIPDIVRLLRGEAREPIRHGEYEFGMFDSVEAMHSRIHELDDEHGLSRMAAGYAWPWVSRNDSFAPDMVFEDYELRWNSTTKDWVNSRHSVSEVGSIHTLQGYDLNYTGVIIGPDLRYDEHAGRVYFDRSNYFDKKGLENNRQRGVTYDDTDILAYVRNIYRVLLTRGIHGTFVYVHDEALRNYIRQFIPTVSSR